MLRGDFFRSTEFFSIFNVVHVTPKVRWFHYFFYLYQIYLNFQFNENKSKVFFFFYVGLGGTHAFYQIFRA